MPPRASKWEVGIGACDSWPRMATVVAAHGHSLVLALRPLRVDVQFKIGSELRATR